MNGGFALNMSAAHRWAHCAQAPSLEAAYPETEPSPASLEGTAAHWVATQLLATGEIVAAGQLAPNGLAVTEEMRQAAADVLAEISGTLGPNWWQVLQVEKPVIAPTRIHVTAAGRPDYFAWSIAPDGRRCLTVWDYKFGFEAVSPVENWALIAYAAAILEAEGIDGYRDLHTEVTLVVIQPRAPHPLGPVRRWPVRASDLRGYINTLSYQAAAAYRNAPPAKPKPSACRDCRGRHACAALQKEARAAADLAGEGGVFALSSNALGLEASQLRKALALLNVRVQGLEADIEHRIKKGERVPGWMLGPTPGRGSEWGKAFDEVVALGVMLGLDFTKPADLITPPQARQKLKAAKLPEALLDAYSKKTPGGVKLIEDDGTDARLTFSSSPP